MGAGLKGIRNRVFLRTKVCPHGRGKELALRMLEEPLHRLQTDHRDLWQIHGVSFANDPDRFIRPGGAAEALTQAEKDVAALGRKPMQGHSDAVRRGAITVEESLRGAMSLPVATTDHRHGEPGRAWPKSQDRAELPTYVRHRNADVRDRVRDDAADGRFELYKLSLKFDNAEARTAHGFPIDTQQGEVKEMIRSFENTGHPYPKLSK